MMLHIRDCPGTTTSFDVCPFPWCRKVKHLLYHLVSCSEPLVCPICSNVHLNRNMRQLKGLNYYRGEKFQAALIAKNKAKAEAEAVEKQNVESSGLEGDPHQSLANSEKNVTSAESNTNGEPSKPSSDTEVDYSIVPPAKGRDAPTNSSELMSGTESMKNFVLAAIKVEDDCETEPRDGDTMKDPTDVSTVALSKEVNITAQVNLKNVDVVAAPGESSVACQSVAGQKCAETTVDSMKQSENPVVDTIAEDFALNTVSPDGTKG